MMKLPPATWIETFLESFTDKSTGLSIFQGACLVHKVSGVMCSASACEHCWSIEGWIHSKRGIRSIRRQWRHSFAHTQTLYWGSEGEFGWLPASSITLGHRVYHRWSRWWARRGARSLSVHYFYSYLLCLWTGLNTTRTQMVWTERKRQNGTDLFLKKNLKIKIKNDHPPKKIKKIK